MRRIGTAALLIVALAVTVAQGAPFEKESLRVRFEAAIAPHVLPRDHAASVRLELGGTISTTDGTRPPALSELSIAFNRAGHLSLKGLPACSASKLQQTTTDAALAACPGALVGHGSFGASLDFPDAPPIPAHGKALLFNARFGGNPAILLHLYGSSPVRAAFVLPFAIAHPARGKFGVSFSTRIPPLASGLGYVNELKLKIGRRYGFDGRRRSVLSASCPLPDGFTATTFELAKARFEFDDGREVTGSVSRVCRVR